MPCYLSSCTIGVVQLVVEWVKNFIMEDYPEDDVAAFFSWKSNIERNEVESRKKDEEQNNKKEMTVTDLSRRLSVSTVVSDSNTARSRRQGEKPSDPRQRMPPNKEIELISKVSDSLGVSIVF